MQEVERIRRQSRGCLSRERLRTPTHMQLVDDVQDVQMPREHGQRKRQTSGTSFRDKVEQIVSAFKQFYMTLSGMIIVG